ncbi:MAG TPA: PQQ-dependent sugar dehydrogenase, partial [Candidatus Limnocylindrales bacterium]|nr:PQQ-dependent sugar dehydrogenase [Candidatus Limnocylindrales bacterium]
GDVGQNAWEEVNVVEKGANLGWNVMEGTQCFRTDPCDRAGLVPPVISYPNAGGECSVTGGFVYRGSALPELRGAYVYGDYCSGRIWALRYRDGSVTAHAEIARAGFRIGSFAQDRAGEIYVLQHAPQGGIYRIAR